MKFLQIFASSLGRDPRPTRFYSLLRNLGSVTVCAAPPVADFPPLENFFNLERGSSSLVNKITRAVGLLCRRYEYDLWTSRRRIVCEQLKGQDFSAIICHDGLLVPLALAIRKARADRSKLCPVILDAREYYPRQFEQNFLWRILWSGLNRYVCQKYFPQLDHIFTVSPGLAQGYRNEYGLECDLLPSFPYYHNIEPSPLREGAVRCIHHGAASPGRKLESMIEAFALLQGRATLDFMLVPNNLEYFATLQKKARLYPNITFIEPVAMQNIVRYISSSR